MPSNAERLLQYCLQKQGAALDFPFGEIPACVKVHGRIFAEIYPRQDDCKITLKCEPILAEVLRRQYPGVVVRGYHCPAAMQPHRNTVYVNQIDEDSLLEMIDHSYEQVIKGLPRRVREELERQSPAAQDNPPI
jgi:predicted DNA-binding protein (MmcQ/YjbR family)